MPGKVTKSSLFGKLAGAINKAISTHAADSTDYGFVRLPGGIVNGIAQLTECKFDEVQTGDNKGQPCFKARATIIEPDTVMTVNGPMKVRGLQTGVWVAMYETKTQKGVVTSLDENVAEMLNHLRMLGGEDFTEGAESEEDLKALMESLVEAAPFFKFTTTSSEPTTQYPNPRVWENWHGIKGLEDYVPPEGTDASSTMEDESEEPEEDEEEEEKPKGKAKKEEAPNANASQAKRGPGRPKGSMNKPKGKPKVEEPEENEEEEESSDFDDFGDLDEIAERADDGDEEAQAELSEKALEFGFTKKDIRLADNWASLVEEMKKGKAEEGEEEEAEEEVEEEEETEEEEEWEPKAGEIYYHSPIDPKTKKKVKKPIEFEVTKVDTKNQTVILKGLDDKKTLIDPKTKKPLPVAWAQLEGA